MKQQLTSTGARPVSVWSRAVGVFGYFVSATVFLPAWLLGIGSVANAPTWLRDGVATLTWAITLAVGIYGLRLFQQRGWL